MTNILQTPQKASEIKARFPLSQVAAEPARIKPVSWRIEAARLWKEFTRTKENRHLRAFYRHVEAGIYATVPNEGTVTVPNEGTANRGTVPIQTTNCPKRGTELSQKRERKVIQEGNPLKDSSTASPKRPSRQPASRIQIVDEEHINQLKTIFTLRSVDESVAKCKSWLLTPNGRGKAFSKKRLQTFLRHAEPIGAAPSQPTRFDIARPTTPPRIIV